MLKINKLRLSIIPIKKLKNIYNKPKKMEGNKNMSRNQY